MTNTAALILVAFIGLVIFLAHTATTAVSSLPFGN
jgi:hypothetical protein